MPKRKRLIFSGSYNDETMPAKPKGPPKLLPEAVVAMWLDLDLYPVTTLKAMAKASNLDYAAVLGALAKRFKTPAGSIEARSAA